MSATQGVESSDRSVALEKNNTQASSDPGTFSTVGNEEDASCMNYHHQQTEQDAPTQLSQIPRIVVQEEDGEADNSARNGQRRRQQGASTHLAINRYSSRDSARQNAAMSERTDTLEEAHQCSTEDEASDWEAPVDVELEETPVLKGKASKASWSTVKALTKWLPKGRPKHSWIQMAGHQGSFLSGPKGSVMKLLVAREERNLKTLMTDTCLKRHVPHFYGTITKEGNLYVQLQDLLSEFRSPCVMDIKMGVRTYLEEELQKALKKPTLRNDLYQKMVSIDVEAPTAEEREQEAITKPRYMKFRDDMSSTSLQGFRIEGIKTQSASSKDYKNTRTRDDVREALSAFVGDTTTALMVGSSLLFVHDDTGKAGVWMIDFAKCCPLPSTVSVTHSSPWIPGNYEDGYLFGIDNLRSIFQEIAANQQK